MARKATDDMTTTKPGAWHLSLAGGKAKVLGLLEAAEDVPEAAKAAIAALVEALPKQAEAVVEAHATDDGRTQLMVRPVGS
jgi:hypothetical protein